MGYFSMVGEKIGGKVVGSKKKKGPKSEMGWGGVVNMKENFKLMKKMLTT